MRYFPFQNIPENLLHTWEEEFTHHRDVHKVIDIAERHGKRLKW
jgi:hypothetical protein